MLTAPQHDTNNSIAKVQNLESFFWDALGFDELDQEIEAGKHAPTRTLIMGTGATHNACYQCSNSATSYQACTCPP